MYAAKQAHMLQSPPPFCIGDDTCRGRLRNFLASEVHSTRLRRASAAAEEFGCGKSDEEPG